MKNHDVNSSGTHHTAFGLFVTLLAIVFITEIFTHMLAKFFHFRILPESLVDGLLVILLAYPALYLFIFRPLSIEIRERKRAEKLKDEFIGTVSHELRTPLSITKEGISLVLDKVPGPINEKQAKILTVAKNNIDRLARIINSLLDISRIESGKAEKVRRDAFDIITVVRQVMNEFELKFKEKGLALRADLPKEGIIIHGNPDATAGVLTNLIGNSLKFTKQGSIDISAKDKDASVEISVSDTGIGIAKEDMPKLFQKFQQFGRVNGPGEKGTGLGLAIAKGIVDAHKGKIWVESEFGKGTTVTFALPKK